jgi:hypothetical protein
MFDPIQASCESISLLSGLRQHPSDGVIRVSGTREIFTAFSEERTAELGSSWLSAAVTVALLTIAVPAATAQAISWLVTI